MIESLGWEVVGAGMRVEPGRSKAWGRVNSESTSRVSCSKQGLSDKDGHGGAGRTQVGSD